MDHKKYIFASGINQHTALDYKAQGATSLHIYCPQEKWVIRSNALHDSGTEQRELTELKVYMPNNSKWTGTIQDFMAIKHIAQNALAALQYTSLHSQVAASGETPEITELKQLLSHFS